MQGGDGEGKEVETVEEGRPRTVPAAPAGTADPPGAVFAAIGQVASMMNQPRSRCALMLVSYISAMLFMLTLVLARGLSLSVWTWVIYGAMLMSSCSWLVHIMQESVTLTGGQTRAGQRRISQAALERRMLLRHPGLDLRRLQLMLTDRDFNSEDYQALLSLDEDNEVPSTVGATDAEIRRNPSFLVGSDEDGSLKPRSCSVCLYQFQRGESVRTIPCLHQFHTECIDPWLRQNAICPVCKFPAIG